MPGNRCFIEIEKQTWYCIPPNMHGTRCLMEMVKYTCHDIP